MYVHLGIWFNVAIVLLGILWVEVVTLVIIVAVGYELVLITSAEFNASYTLWYERFSMGTSLFPRTRQCDPSVIKIGEPISTNKTSLFDYTLQTYNDTRANTPVDGMTYISKSHLEVRNSELLNISEVMKEWNIIKELVLDIIAPYEQMSVFQPSLIAYNLSSIRFAYYAFNAAGAPNSPADDHWAIQFSYTLQGQWKETTCLISFLPTGEIDLSRTSMIDLNITNTILAPSIQQLQNLTGTPNSFDFWKFISWIVLSNHWLLLYDFGQVVPTYSDTNLVDAGNQLQTFTSTNNIFINNTLFNISATYLRDVPWQIIKSYFNIDYSPPQFLVLDNNNSLQPFNTTLLRSYSCVEKRMKEWISVTIFVIAADYAFIVGGYKALVWLVGIWMKHIDKDANSCEKCVDDGTRRVSWSEAKYRKVDGENSVCET